MSDKPVSNEKVRSFTVTMDFNDPIGFANQVDALTDPNDLLALMEQLNSLAEKIEAAGIYVTTKLLMSVAGRPKVEGLSQAEEKLFEGKVAQA